MAHDLIHIVFTLLIVRLEQKRFVLSVHRTDRVGNGPEVWGTEVIATTGRLGAKQNAPDSV